MTTRTVTERTDDGSAPTLVSPRGKKALETGPPSLGKGSEPLAPRGLGLGTQFFLAAALLVLVTLGSAIAIATWRANLIAERSIRDAMQEIPRVLSAWRSGLEGQLRDTLRSIAEEPGTKGLFATDDATVHEWAVTKAGVLGAKTVFLFDQSGALIARSDRAAGEERGRSFATVRWVEEPLETVKDVAAAIREGKTLSAVAAVPVVAGDPSLGEARLLGVLAATLPFDDGRARAVRGLTGGQVAFVADVAKRGEPPELALSAATRTEGASVLVAALGRDRATVDALFREGRWVGPLDVLVGKELRIVKAVPVASAGGEVLGAIVVSRSREEETAAFRQIRNALLGIGAAALLVSVPISFALARRIARPLAQLAAGAIAIRDGNLDVPLPESRTGEVGTLARAFAAMVEDLKEKAQLEALLGELQRRPEPGAEATAAYKVADGGALVKAGPKAGELFAGRYEVLSMLGQGGMGTVYRVLDHELDEDIALKVLTPDAFDQGTQAVQTLKQEIRLARKITHPNVVRTHDLGEAAGMRFLTMEFVPGTTLREVIDRRGGIAVAPGLQIGKQLCRGLSAVHDAGIIHRDIKPQNIMVLPNGVVKLMDFGIARTAEGIDLAAMAGLTVGTPYYMSPEQAVGRQLDARSDLYTVGVVLYELFTGQRPFEAHDPVDAMRQHISSDPPAPTLVRPDLPEYLERVLLACLAKNPDRRPQTAQDLYAALTRVQT